MREILFRGKRLRDGRWVVGNLFIPDRDDAPTEICVGTNIMRFSYDVDHDTVGQYTGLTGKNGKRIFEGDIVLKRTYNGKRAFPVTFTGGMFHAGYGGGSSTATHGYTLDDRQIEVIGNRWDNPELLEGAK